MVCGNRAGSCPDVGIEFFFMPQGHHDADLFPGSDTGDNDFSRVINQPLFLSAFPFSEMNIILLRY